MSSTSLFPVSAEPPGGDEPVLPLRWSTELLIQVGRLRRRLRHGRPPVTGPGRFGYADPPTYVDPRGIESALPEGLPHRQTADEGRWLPETDFAASELSMRATAWAARIAEEVDRVGLASIASQVESVACGFVTDGRRLGFGLVCYVSRLGLTQAAPWTLEVDDERFPVVLRPVPADIDSGALTFPGGLATGSAQLGGELGTLTAAHVVAPDGDRMRVAQGDKVQCCVAGCPSHVVLRADPVMDAVLVGTGPASGLERVIRTMPVPGYFPVEMRSPSGQLVAGWVTEVPLPEGVVPGSRGRAPTSPAMLTLSFAGEHGWSGGLVREVQSRESFGADAQPYGMFLGARRLRTAVVGRMNMLVQLETVWGIQLVED
jgi:hypothetical protein